MLQEMRARMVRFGIVLLFALLACSVTPAQDVTTNAMPGTDFSKYHTYKWVAIQGASYPNQIMDPEIKNSIDSQLSAKGLKKTDNETADLYIGYQASVDQEKQWTAYGTGGGWRFCIAPSAHSCTSDS